MKKVFLNTSIIALSFFGLACNTEQQPEKGLKDYYKGNCLIGAAIYPEVFDKPASASLLTAEFNCITPENDMKWERIHPTLEEYTFDRADRIVEFAQANSISLIGHTLVWHSQMGKGIFIQSATFFTNSTTVFLFSTVAEISRKTSSSAPSSS